MGQREIDQIITLIKKEAETVANPDPCARLYNVSMSISSELIALMEKEREEGRKAKNHVDI